MKKLREVCPREPPKRVWPRTCWKRLRDGQHPETGEQIDKPIGERDLGFDNPAEPEHVDSTMALEQRPMRRLRTKTRVLS